MLGRDGQEYRDWKKLNKVEESKGGEGRIVMVFPDFLAKFEEFSS
jgi:hypothetical protein